MKLTIILVAIVFLLTLYTILYSLNTVDYINQLALEDNKQYLEFKKVREEREVWKRVVDYCIKSEQCVFVQPEQSVEGIASWYSYRIGEWDSANHYVCAARDWPRGTILSVSSATTGRTANCTVTDYGPQEWTNRIIDLSPRVFSELAPLSKGLEKVIIEEN